MADIRLLLFLVFGFLSFALADNAVNLTGWFDDQWKALEALRKTYPFAQFELSVEIEPNTSVPPPPPPPVTTTAPTTVPASTKAPTRKLPSHTKRPHRVYRKLEESQKTSSEETPKKPKKSKKLQKTTSKPKATTKKAKS